MERWKKLMELKYVGEKSAKLLYKNGFRTKEDVLNARRRRLASIIGPVGYRILKENKAEKKLLRGIRRRILSGLQSFRMFLSLRRTFVMGIYGPPNSGKTTLANKISMDFLGEEMGVVSDIPHETTEVAIKKGVKIDTEDGSLKIDLADTPGYITKIDQKEFTKHGMTKKEAYKRTVKASQGVIEAIKFLDKINLSLVVFDAAKAVDVQENMLLLENLKYKNIPFLIVANKTDLKGAKPKELMKSFQQHTVIPISAKMGHNIDNLYSKIVKTALK